MAETRTAPRWIREREKRYERTRLVRVFVTAAGILAVLAFTFGAALRHPAWRQAPALLWPMVLPAWGSLRRSDRYQDAAGILNAAIARYEVSEDRPESALDEAGRRAREIARVERIRTAPGRIRSLHRQYSLKILGWFSPSALALLMLAATYALQRIPGSRPYMLLAAAACLWGARFAARKSINARGILSQAIERYEYESAATEGELDEAGRHAAEIAAS